MYKESRSARVVRPVIAAVFICALALSSTLAQGVKQKVRFARGTSSATIHGAVVRGDRDRYYVSAKRGQTMSVKITSTESNAVFRRRAGIAGRRRRRR
jgi:hypothetical protein